MGLTLRCLDCPKSCVSILCYECSHSVTDARGFDALMARARATYPDRDLDDTAGKKARAERVAKAARAVGRKKVAR